jgi:4-amino-4-deoxy-L-arabinose transferase-like glycosyltransferase
MAVPRLRDLKGGEQVALVVLLVVAAALRFWWNDVRDYSPADETVYARYTATLTERGFVGGYPEITRAFLDEPRRWSYPSPVRWGYFALSTVAADAFGGAEPRALAWLSTLAGLACVPLVFMLGLRLFGTRVALLAAAFASVSSVGLALGRRALQDEVFCLAVLVALMAFLRVVDSDHGKSPPFTVLIAVASLTMALAVKESFFLLYPALVAVLFVYRKPRQVRLRDAALFVLPPLLYVVGFMVLSRSVTGFFRIAGIVASSMSAPYVVQYQAGPPHRLLFDLFIVAPFVSLLAAAAVVLVVLQKTAGRSERALVAFTVVALAVLAVAATKNLRFYAVVDPVIRLLAAWVMVSPAASGVRLIAVAAANAAIELELFYAIFIKHGVYDPVTQELLTSLAALPRGNPQLDSRMFFPWICAAIVALAWAWGRRHRAA